MQRWAAEVRDPFRSAAMTRGAGDERGNQQRIALHQSKHRSLARCAGRIDKGRVVARSLHDFDRFNNAAAVAQQPLSSLATRRAHDFARQLLSTAQAPPAAWIRTQSLRASPPV